MLISSEYFVLSAETSFVIKNKTRKLYPINKFAILSAGVSNILPSLVDSLSLSCFFVADQYNALVSDGSV
jgi:hypothetical protein